MVVSKEFYGAYVTLPPPNTIPNEIKNNPRFYPFFKDCCGAVDGSLLDAFVALIDMARYQRSHFYKSPCCLLLQSSFLLSSLWMGRECS
jgi:hypothetical protein